MTAQHPTQKLFPLNAYSLLAAPKTITTHFHFHFSMSEIIKEGNNSEMEENISEQNANRYETYFFSYGRG